MRCRLSLSALILLLVVCPALFAQRGAITIQQTLPELVSPAGVIVRGHVISAGVEPHPRFPNLMTVVVTLSADAVLKGSTGKTYTFRQFVWDQRDVMDAAGGTPWFTWSIVGGTLPPGMAINSGSNSFISGTPTTAGAYTFTLQVRDSGSPAQIATRTLTLNVVAGP